MNILKLILGALGVFFAVLVMLWLLGWVWSLIWYLMVFGIVGAVGYGAYRLFRTAERKALGADTYSNIGTGAEIPMSWDEYDRKYLHK
jgi:hypothetical protein